MKKSLYLTLSFSIILLICSCQKKQNKITNQTETSDLFESKSTSDLLGKKLYNNKCAACHRPNGQGITNAFPPLAKSDYLNDTPTKAIEAVIKGISGEIIVNGTKYNSVMSPISVSDEETAQILTYIYSQWGNNNTIITAEMVNKLR